MSAVFSSVTLPSMRYSTLEPTFQSDSMRVPPQYCCVRSGLVSAFQTAAFVDAMCCVMLIC
jgi:hypothetical protein